MKNLLLVFSLIPMIAFAEGPDDLVDNGLFFRDKQYYEYYLKENAKHLGDALKSFTTASKAWDTCPPKDENGLTSYQDLITQKLNEKWKNFSFWKIDTNKFYTDDDASKFKCSMDVSLILANYPKDIREKHISSRIEDGNMEYWGKLGIAARWKIVADSLKDCGIKISSLEMTVMEKADGSPPDIDLSKNEANELMEPFRKRDRFSNKKSLKYVYVRNYIAPTENEAPGVNPNVGRTNPGFEVARSLYDSPDMNAMWFKRESIYAPIVQKNASNSERKYALELHETYHALTNEDNHAHYKSDPSVPRNPLKVRMTQTNGSFTTGPGGQCETMIEKGRERGFLRCN